MPLAIDEFQRVDRVADGAQGFDQAHALGHVPAGAEEVHHVAFGAQAGLALDHQRIEAVALELDGEREPGDAAAGNEDAFAVHDRFLRSAARLGLRTSRRNRSAGATSRA